MLTRTARKGSTFMERLRSRFKRDFTPEVIGPCRACNQGSVFVVGWTGWEEILSCTTPGCHGRE